MSIIESQETSATSDEVEPESVEAVESVEVRRNTPLAAGVGLVAALLAIGYLARTVGGGSALDVVFFLITGGVAAAHLSALMDAKAPLLVIDAHGVRSRKGNTWRGIAWPEVEQLEHHPRAGLKDGQIVIVGIPGALADKPITIPLSLSTRLHGVAAADLTDALDELAAGRTEIYEVVPEASLVESTSLVEPVETTDTSLVEPVETTVVSTSSTSEIVVTAMVEPVETETEIVREDQPSIIPSPTPSPLRKLVRAVRHEVRNDDLAGIAQRRQQAADDETEVLPKTTDVVETVVIENLDEAPALPPVVGPELYAARTRLGLSVDQLAERTRIRPHVIESIEVDDFGPCGGDFYARGHLRTLARVLGVDAAPLLTSYDDRYADAPIDARRVFEAELATGGSGSIRGTRGGPNWSILVAAVMAVILVWSVARLAMDGPVPLDKAPMLNGSPSGQKAKAGDTPKVPVVLTAPSGGAKIVVRDASGNVVFDSQLAFGQSASLKAVPPLRIWTSDGSVTAKVDDGKAAALGDIGEETQKTIIAK